MKKVFLFITAVLIFAIIGFAFYITRPVKKDALNKKPKAATKIEKPHKAQQKASVKPQPVKPENIEPKPEPPQVHKDYSEKDKKKLEELLNEAP